MAQFQSPTIQNPQVLNPVDPAIENYMRGLVKSTDHPVLLAMEAEAKQNNFPIIDRLAGVFIYTMTKSIRAQRVFEFGSGYGYSAYWFAKAVGGAGKVICTDGNPDNKIKAERYLTDAGLWQVVDFHTGMAEAIFAQTDGEFDICYNDADKGDYPAIWLMAKDRIRPGGYYIADNTLWHGRVALNKFEDIVPGWTEAIQAHNAMIFNDPDFDAFINPTRDGVLVARKSVASN